jgi:hypothetical protein
VGGAEEGEEITQSSDLRYSATFYWKEIMTVMPDMLANGFSASSTIVVIYHNQERNLADKVVAPLIEAGYEIVFAPLGLQIGSDIWKEKVRPRLAKNRDRLISPN